LASAGGDLDLQCLHSQPAYKDTLTCLFDLKFGVHETLSVLEHCLVLKTACETSPTYCTAAVFDVVGALGNLANYVLAGIGNCQSHPPAKIGCGESIGKLTAAISGIVSSAINAAEFCRPEALVSAGSSPAVTAPPAVGADFQDWVKQEISKGVSSQVVKANVASAMQQNLSKVARLFTSRGDIPEKKVSQFNFHTYLLASALPVALLMGFLAGRRGMPSRRETCVLEVNQAATRNPSTYHDVGTVRIDTFRDDSVANDFRDGAFE